MESDASMAATNAEVSLKDMQPSSPQTADTGTDAIDAETASIIIKQQARRIDELEKANEALREQAAHVA